MSKKAFCVGINDYPFEGNDLKGCVNDAVAWADLLKNHYGFTDIKMLTDTNATKANIISGIKNLLAKAKSGDILVFTNASHGTYVADTDGDEPGYDEALCPYDMSSNLMIIDDELRNIFKNIPKGVMFTVISDSCHSGSVTRVVVDSNLRHRMLPPHVWGGRELTEEQMRAARKKKQTAGEMFPESGMNEILLSGCKSNQTSADAFINNTFRGAMSYYAIKAITDAKYKLTYKKLQQHVVQMLADENFEQVPQLEGKNENKTRQIFT